MEFLITVPIGGSLIASQGGGQGERGFLQTEATAEVG